MPQDPLLTPGDNLSLIRTLYEDGVAASLTGATVFAAIQDKNGNAYISSTAQVSTATGADWPNGVLVCEFSQAQSLLLPRSGDCWLEIEVTRSGKKATWPLIRCELQAPSI